MRHFGILAGLASADQSEFSRFDPEACLASAMSDINFSSDAFAISEEFVEATDSTAQPAVAI